MKHKKIVFTTGIVAASIALGVAGTFGFRNLDEQWTQVNQAQKKLKVEQQDVARDLTDLEQREATVEEKIRHAELIHKEASKLKSLAEKETSTAQSDQKSARVSKEKGLEAEQEFLDKLKQASIAQTQAISAEKNHLIARDASHTEQQKFLIMKTEASKVKKLSESAITKAKKAESTAAWYQKKAKKDIAQAECDIAEASKMKAKARSVFRQIDQLENEVEKLEDKLECSERDYVKLDKEFHDLERKYNCLETEQKNLISKKKAKIRKLEQQNAEYCRIIASNRNITSELRRSECEVKDYKGKLDSQKRETHRHRENVKKKERLISDLKRELAKKKK